MTVKNILIIGAAGVALIYWLGSQKAKEPNLPVMTQYGGLTTDPQNVETESGVYRV